MLGQSTFWGRQPFILFEGGAKDGSLYELPERKWRYYVFSTEDNGTDLINLQRASEVTDIPLDLMSLTLLRPAGMMSRAGSLLRRFNDVVKDPVKVGKRELKTLKEPMQRTFAGWGEHCTPPRILS